MIIPYQYGVNQRELLRSLINTANPSALLPFDALNTELSAPSHSNEQTAIRVIGRSQYYGSKTINYKRLSLGSLFRNTVVAMDLWSDGTTLTREQVVDELNLKYGTAFLYTDFPNQTQSVGNTTWTTVPGCLCYVGNITVNWTKGKRKLSSLFQTTNELPIRFYPGGSEFPVERKPQGQYFVYGADFSGIKANLNNISLGTAFNSSNADHLKILQTLQALRPDLNFTDTSPTSNGGLAGLMMYRYTLPQASVPFANSEQFTNVFVIVPLADSWFQGNILLHYI